MPPNLSCRRTRTLIHPVTRNVAHFQPTGVEVLCPWQGYVGQE
jgi:hypothetical protein